jgi:SAM-dependent methyltransferase
VCCSMALSGWAGRARGRVIGKYRYEVARLGADDGTAFPVSAIFPPLEDELEPLRGRLTGRILNAGSGSRDLSAMVDGDIVNQDIDPDLPHIDIVSPLHEIPVEDAHFDVAICNAVLEHVRNPHEVVQELHRVIRPGGLLVLTVPFMQPEHLDPTDFQRYTIDGLQELVRRHEFEVEHAEGLHSVYTTLAWIGLEWHRVESGLVRLALRRAVLPWLWRRALRSGTHAHPLASAYRVLATRR